MFRPSRFSLQPPILNLIKLLYCQVLLFHVVATQWSDRPKAISHMSLHDKAVGRYENPGGGGGEKPSSGGHDIPLPDSDRLD